MRTGAGRKSGFTIIELMLVVGIIGIIATIAIPLMLRFQLRAKAAEGRINMAGIFKAEEAYYSEYGRYVSALPAVPTTVGVQRQAWALAATDSHGFNTIGFAPEGHLFFQYGVTANDSLALTIAARSDIDGDGVYNTWAYMKPIPGTGSGISGPFGTCQASGVFDPASGSPNQFDLVGPCDSLSGSSEY